MRQSLTFLVALLLSLHAVCAQLVVTPVAYPAIQSSVTSTAFNPALTNAGGTTNSAGTFNVVSLARSSSFEFNSALPQTTSFVIAPAPVAPVGDVSTPAYLTEATAAPAAAPATGASSAAASSISLPTTGRFSSIIAVVSSNADSARLVSAMGSVWTLALSASVAILGAVFVL